MTNTKRWYLIVLASLFVMLLAPSRDGFWAGTFVSVLQYWTALAVLSALAPWEAPRARGGDGER